MQTLFLCGIYPQPHKVDIFKNSKKGYQFAAQNLQEALVEGFIQNKINISIVTIPFLSTFPLGYRKPIVKYDFSKFNGIVSTKCTSFVNIPFLQQFLSTAKKDVFEWCRSHNGNKHILVYSLNSNLMDIAIKAKKRFKDVELTVIVPDLPEYMGSNPIYNALGLKERNIKWIYNNISYFNNFVLLSEAMSVPLGLDNHEFVVMEGIFNSNSQVIENFEFEADTKVVLYTGALSQKYGIDNLIEAFLLIPDSSYRLVICGDGDAKELVQEKALTDNRILYLGKVSHESILAIQKKASLLVNPRTPEGEYTKFSFPSKTMEYFASGRPVLMYKLPGVPIEYFDYCYTLDELTIDALSKKISYILSLPTEVNERIGRKASDFILREKNPKNQVIKIVELINRA